MNVIKFRASDFVQALNQHRKFFSRKTWKLHVCGLYNQVTFGTFAQRSKIETFFHIDASTVGGFDVYLDYNTVEFCDICRKIAKLCPANDWIRLEAFERPMLYGIIPQSTMTISAQNINLVVPVKEFGVRFPEPNLEKKRVTKRVSY